MNYKLAKNDMMITGAVCASDQLYIHMGFSLFHAYAPHDQKFVPLDKESAGLVSSEGASVVVLKRLSDAEKDGNKILGVIGAIGLSNDGAGKFLLSPNPKGQALALQRAYRQTDFTPENTQYLECHATGTPLGDKTEMNSVADFFSQCSNKPRLGSVKSNMGHLLTVAGMTGLHKVLLSIKHGKIPPNINLKDALASENNWISKDQMILEPTSWDDEVKQAGINAFGFGGTNAHMVLQNHHSEIKSQTSTALEPVDLAIIGMDAHFGTCKSLEEFHDAIYYDRQQFTPLPASRWKGFEEYSSLLHELGIPDGSPPKAAYIESFEIDLLRYKIQPKEAETLEPQQALILKVADKAIQDAGLEKGGNVAVLIAMEPEFAAHQNRGRWDLGWQLEQAFEQSNIELPAEVKSEILKRARNSVYTLDGEQTPSQHTSFVGNIMSSRISSLWDFNGPSFTVSCAENAVFKAIEIAEQMLRLEDVEAVVVGGVDFAAGMEHLMVRSAEHHLEDQLQTKFGEGAGAVVLSRKDKNPGSKSYAIIKPEQQKNNFSAVGLLEICDGAPTVPLNILGAQADLSIASGSISQQFGNTYTASGIAGIIKTALCLHYRFIPEGNNITNGIDHPAVYQAKKSHPWILEEGQTFREAIIANKFGPQLKLSQSEEAPNYQSKFLKRNLPYLCPIQAPTHPALIQKLEIIESEIAGGKDLRTICKTASQDYQKAADTKNLILCAKSPKKFQSELRFFKSKLADTEFTGPLFSTPSGSIFNPHPLGEKAKIAFVFPGASTAYEEVGRELLALFPELYVQFSEQDKSLNKYLASRQVFPRSKDSSEGTIYDQPLSMISTGVFYATCHSHILRKYLNCQPDLAMGYSMGECSGMWYGLDMWDPLRTDSFRNSPIFLSRFAGDLELLAEHWGISTETAKEKWTSLILFVEVRLVQNHLNKYDQVYLTFINTDREVIISGDKNQCLELASELEANFMEVPFQNVIHHDFCIKERPGLIEIHHHPLLDKPKTKFWSSIRQAPLSMDPDEIAENAVQVCSNPVDFPKSVLNVFEQGYNVFIECGPNATCTRWIKEILKGKDFAALSMDQKGKNSGQALMEAVALLLSHGIPLDLDFIYETEKIKVKKRKSFYKEIIPGGRKIREVLLEKSFVEEVQKNIKRKEVVHMALADVAYGSKLKMESYSSAKKSSFTMSEINTPIINETKTKKYGPNGLRIWDFESGEHLEGKNIVFDEDDLQEFANGKISKVFGPEYEIIDTYRRRVMLPMDPYLLVSRVTELRGKTNVFEPSFMQTEYDIPHAAWFLTDGQIPWCVSVESGQCDLLLISYLGIDFQNKGDLVYRLLDCTLTFMDDMPCAGQILRYDISINSFVRNGENLLFFFSYRCYVDDRLVLKMDNGCAGFFSDGQLEEGNGVVYTDAELQAKEKAEKRHFTPLLKTHKRSFSKQDLRHLIDGNPHLCFEDESYYANGRNPSLRIPPEKILMLDRITSVDPQGGAYGLGLIIAEKDLHPDDWFFPCHFRDDEVLAGSLQSEGGGNLMRFYALFLGLQRLRKDAMFQPLFDLPHKVRCRKQVTPKDTKLVYKLEIKEIGLFPDPYMIGDLEIISDGIITVHFENLGLQIREKDNPKYLQKHEGMYISPRSEGALMNEKDVTTFALDQLYKCFGPEYKIYQGRQVSHQPNTDLQMISRVLRIEGERHKLDNKPAIYTEYDVPDSVWYYDDNASITMPYSILMEIALQPCGLLGAWLGSTLQFPDDDLCFRNLDGNGILHPFPTGTDFRNAVISNKSVLVSSVALGGTVLQNYTFEVSIDGQMIYEGKAAFGFFPPEQLKSQIGLDNGKYLPPWFEQEGLVPSDYMQIKLDSLYGKMKLFKAPEQKAHYRLSTDQLNLLDTLKIAKESGKYGKGYIHAKRAIHTYDWFFTCHFYEDPVMPGSLGVEAMLQAMQVFALQQDLGKKFISPRFVQLADHETVWKYRGQILQHVKEMQLEVHIKSVDMVSGQLQIIADASLWNDEVRIYEVTDLGLGIDEA